MMHNINIFCNSDYVGFIQIDLESNIAELNYDNNWKEIGFELSPHLKFNTDINSNSIKKFVSNLFRKMGGKRLMNYQIEKSSGFDLIPPGTELECRVEKMVFKATLN